MKIPNLSRPMIQVMPLKRETEPVTPASCSSLADLIHSLGTRKELAEKWQIGARTLALRMEKPETATLEELQRLAVLAKVDLPTIFQLAYYQMQNPVVVPAPRRGAPVRKH